MGLLTIFIFLGYVDQRPALNLANQSMQQQIVAALLSPCSQNQVACGFQMVSSQQFEKQNGTQRVQINLRTAAFSLRDDLNRGMYLAQQKALSEAVTAEFWRALQTANSAVFYLGHSRYGWGPDFAPPVILSNGRVNKAHYQNSAKMASGFRTKAQMLGIRARTVGLFSCDSDDIISGSLQSQIPQTQFLGTTKALLPDQAVDQFLESLNLILL